MTSIEWVQDANGNQGKTWNPITGCKKVSPGCANCYAEGIAKRFWGDRKFTDVQFHSERLDQPLRWRKPRMVFVNSMSDLFHESITDEQLDQMFAVMALTPQHTYQVLTKRPERMLEYFSSGREKRPNQTWLEHRCNLIAFEALKIAKKQNLDCNQIKLPLPNVWLGVTVENQATANQRIPLLLQTPAAVRFLSCEPLLEDVNIARWLYPVVRTVNGTGFLNGKANVGTSPNAKIGWVIVGGESGPGARSCDIAWIRSIVEQCKAAEVPCFVKQLGHRPMLDGKRYPVSGKGNIPEEWHEDLRVRQMPMGAAA